MMNVEDTIGKLRSLQPGQRMVYHLGLLSHDKAIGAPVAKDSARRIGGVALDLAEEERVVLVQKKLGYAMYEYIAIGRR